MSEEERFSDDFIEDVKEFEGTKEVQSSQWAEDNLGHKTYVNDRFIPHRDTDGSWIIGYGTKISEEDYEHYKDGITEEEASGLLDTRLGEAEDLASKLVNNYHTLPEDVQEVLVDLTYNMGYGKVGEDFTGFLKAIEKKNYPMAMAQLKFIDPVAAGIPINDLEAILTGDQLSGISKYHEDRPDRSIYNLEKLEDAYQDSLNTKTDDGVFNVLKGIDEFA